MSDDKKMKYYRAEGVPAGVMTAFDAAVEKLNRAAAADGRGSLSSARAFSALLRAIDLEEQVIAGQAIPSGGDGPRVDRGFHVPVAQKERLLALAEKRSIKVGAVGRLVLLAQAAKFQETISLGLALAGAKEAPPSKRRRAAAAA